MGFWGNVFNRKNTYDDCIDMKITESLYQESLKKGQKEMLACDLLTGHGGLSVAQARKIAGMGQVDPEIEAIKQKIEADMWEFKMRENFRIMDEETRLKRKEKIKNPKSIWIRNRVCRD